MRYWLNVSSLRSWSVEVDTDRYMIGGVKKWLNTFTKIRPGDLIAEYLSKGAQSFIAILRATSYVYEDRAEFWPHGLYPFRVDREVVLVAPSGSLGCPGRDLARRLEFVRQKSQWGRYLQLKIREISETDMTEIRKALENIGAMAGSAKTVRRPPQAAASESSSLRAGLEETSVVGSRESGPSMVSSLYKFYRSKGLDNAQARMLEEVHFLLSHQDFKHGDVIDVLSEYNFLANELALPQPIGVIAERIGKLEAEKASLLASWARLSVMTQVLDLDRLRTKLRAAGLFPTARP